MLTQSEMSEQLESLLDKSDLSALLLALARVCDEKAEHLLVNWQDKPASRAWERAAAKLDKLAADSAVEAVS